MGTTESAERTESAKARPSTRNQEHADNKAPEKTETTNDEKLWQDSVKDLCESNQPKTFKQMKEMMQAYDFKVLSLSESFAASCFEEGLLLDGRSTSSSRRFYTSAMVAKTRHVICGHF